MRRDCEDFVRERERERDKTGSGGRRGLYLYHSPAAGGAKWPTGEHLKNPHYGGAHGDIVFWWRHIADQTWRNQGSACKSAPFPLVPGTGSSQGSAKLGIIQSGTKVAISDVDWGAEALVPDAYRW